MGGLCLGGSGLGGPYQPDSASIDQSNDQTQNSPSGPELGVIRSTENLLGLRNILLDILGPFVDSLEKEIRAAEERLLEEDIPRTADEFEKMVRSSPNSSFIWIKYMDLMISMADVEKARSIAKRALRTINIREENEKLNIWKAYLNLENEYGNPKEEAVMKVFQRALRYNYPKKIYLSLLGVSERTEQHQLADELVNKMTKKFKHSCKIWLRLV